MQPRRISAAFEISMSFEKFVHFQWSCECRVDLTQAVRVIWEGLEPGLGHTVAYATKKLPWKIVAIVLTSMFLE